MKDSNVVIGSPSRGTEYYAERLLSQAISDPRVNALKSDEMRAYIEQEAEKLCIPPEETADYAMRGYKALTTGDFKRATHYRVFPEFETAETESTDLSDTPSF